MRNGLWYGPGVLMLTLSSGSGCDEASPKSIATTSSPEPLRTMKLDVVRSPCTTWNGAKNEQPQIGEMFVGVCGLIGRAVRVGTI